MSNFEKPFDLIFKRAVENIRSRIEECAIGGGAGANDSPIEHILDWAIAYEIEIGDHWHVKCLRMPRGIEFQFQVRPLGEVPLVVQSQLTVLGRRVDFVISTFNNSKSVSHLIVECDGHDFHERTKAQAKADRSFDRKVQEAGFTIFRFTGSEIWNDPCACALQIIEWAGRELRK